jgi:hypothetical protein
MTRTCTEAERETLLNALARWEARWRNTVRVTKTKEEIQDEEKAQFDRPALLEEQGVPFDVDGVRYSVQMVQGVEKFIVNTTLSVAMGHEGANPPGAVVEDARFFPLADEGKYEVADGKFIDDNDSRRNMNLSMLRSIAYAAFGGKSANEPGRYPVDDNGDFFDPWVALEQFSADCGQIVADVSPYTSPKGKQYTNLKKIRAKE